MKHARNTSQSQRFRLVVLGLGCFLVSMTFIVISRPGISSFAHPADGNSVENTHRSRNIMMPEFSSSFSLSSGGRDSQIIQEKENYSKQESIQEDEKKELTKSDNNDDQSESKSDQEIKSETQNEVVINTKSEANTEPVSKTETESNTKTESKSETELDSKIDEERRLEDEPHKIALPTVSNYNISDMVQEDTASPEQSGENADGPQIMNTERKPLCDTSGFRVDVCDMNGDIRIPGNTSSVLYIEQGSNNETYIIHPYPRKGDKFCFTRVHEVTVKSSNAPVQCTKNYTVPVVVFSTGGYGGNLFHDFTDLLIPLFLTAGEFDGEVLLIATDFSPYWIYKYIKFFQKLSHYPVIDFEKDKEVNCFNRAIVGLRAHNELTIDPTRSPKGFSMVDFTKFVRSAYSLPREAITSVENSPTAKPRLMLVARKRTRTFTNVDEIVQMAQDLGFEVVVHDAEAGIHIAEFAELVNSCDVLMGVHGAGLTNAMFLPPNATLIQVVPWGSLEGISMMDFGNPAKAMSLHYLQYSISIDESSLLDKYPRDHPVFTEPLKIHGQGFHKLRTTYLDQQNVKLDVKRFRSVLWKALEHIIQ